MHKRLSKASIPALSVLLAATLCGKAADLNIELTVAERHGINRTAQPVTSGVPLPEGVMDNVTSLRLVDTKGREIPCQITPTVRWWRDRSVRWALLDFQAHVSAYSMRTFYLRDDAPAAAIENPIEVKDSGERLLVTTGPLRFAVRKRKFNLIDEAWIDQSGDRDFNDATQVVAPDRMSGPVLWSNHPDLPDYRRYMAANDPDSKVTIEEQGPMRVVIRAEGRHLPDDPSGPDDKLLDYVIRIHAYRGKPYVRIFYSAECKQGENIRRFTSVDRWHVVIPGNLGNDLQYVFGGETAPVIGTFGNHDRAWLVCDSANSYEVGGAAFKNSSLGVLKGQPMLTRARRFGYMNLSGQDKGITIASRWLWQNYPKGLFAYKDGSAHLALWPSFSKRTPTYAAEPRAHFFPGMSKTHEFVIEFNTGSEDQKKPIELNAMAQAPLFASCAPEWYCEKTRAFGKLASSRPALYPDSVLPVVRAYDHYFEQNRRAMLNARDFVRDTNAYGMFNFGDCINHITANRRATSGERHCPTDIHWDNNYYGYPHSLIVQFARTGSFDFLELAEQASTHLQDVDILCWHPNSDDTGAPRYSAGPDHVRIYGKGNDPVFASPTYNHYKNQSLFERFWLFGDRRALEIGLLSAGYARRHKTSAISQSRSIGHGIVGLLSAYETTLDASYLEAAETIIEETRGFTRSKHGAWIDGIALEGHRAWYEITGDKKAIETVLGGADAAIKKGDRAGAILHAFAFAYGQTGDAKYKEMFLSGLKNNARGRKASMMKFGNAFRSAGYGFWYLTESLPPKEQVPVLEWKKE